jgi:hypothetical protein
MKMIETNKREGKNKKSGNEVKGRNKLTKNLRIVKYFSYAV